jgi:hypothetical protein
VLTTKLAADAVGSKRFQTEEGSVSHPAKSVAARASKRRNLALLPEDTG